MTEILLVALAVVVVVVGWLRLEHYGSLWFKMLPDKIRERGLIGLLLDKIKGRSSS